MLETLAHDGELSHSLPLELFNKLVLLLKLVVGAILECAELKCLVSSLLIKFLVQVILAVVNLLHDILLTLYAGLHLSIKLILKTYSVDIVKAGSESRLTVKSVLCLINLFVGFSYSVFDFLGDGVFKTI